MLISDLLGGLDEVRIGKVGVARRGAVPPMPDQHAGRGQGLFRNDRRARRRVP